MVMANSKVHTHLLHVTGTQDEPWGFGDVCCFVELISNGVVQQTCRWKMLDQRVLGEALCSMMQR